MADGSTLLDVEPVVPRSLGPGATLLVASTGGHLQELHRLRQRLWPPLAAVEWATFATDQSRHMLEGERVNEVPFVGPKDVRGALRSVPSARQLVHSGRFARVISTGAAIAVPFLTAARSAGVAAHYIESAARIESPSLSGRIIAKIPGVRLYSQSSGLSTRRWKYRGSVFDAFTPGRTRNVSSIDKVVVTLGTQHEFGFRRAVESLVKILPEVCAPHASVLWQTGGTDTDGLNVNAFKIVPLRDLEQAIREADLVVSHAGVGSALQALDYGKCPVLLPRRYAFLEHTDDHQHLIAGELSRRGLALQVDASHLSAHDLVLATSMTAEVSKRPSQFVLQPD